MRHKQKEERDKKKLKGIFGPCKNAVFKSTKREFKTWNATKLRRICINKNRKNIEGKTGEFQEVPQNRFKSDMT